VDLSLNHPKTKSNNTNGGPLKRI